MPRTDAFYQWRTRIDTPYGAISLHHRRALAEYSFGMVLAKCRGLTSVVAVLATHLCAGAHDVRQRLREFYQPASARIGSARSEFDHTTCFGPLVRWAPSDHSDRRLVVAPDPTNLTDRVLCAAVLYRGCGLPVAWWVTCHKCSHNRTLPLKRLQRFRIIPSKGIPMSRRKSDPLRTLADAEVAALGQSARPQSAPAAEVARAKALLAVHSGLASASAAELPAHRPGGRGDR